MPDRKKVIERLKGLQILSESSGSMGVFILPDLIREMLELLEEQEQNQMDIITCSECKFHDSEMNTAQKWCLQHLRNTMDDDWCSFAEGR